MHLGFTGTSGRLTPEQESTLIDLLQWLRQTHTYLHHGDCVGADKFVHDVALDMEYKIIVHPPTNIYKRAFCQDASHYFPPLPYMARNTAIVRASDSLVVAPNTMQEILRSGTWATVRRMRKLHPGSERIIVWPTGDQSIDNKE